MSKLKSLTKVLTSQKKVWKRNSVLKRKKDLHLLSECSAQVTGPAYFETTTSLRRFLQGFWNAGKAAPLRIDPIRSASLFTRKKIQTKPSAIDSNQEFPFNSTLDSTQRNYESDQPQSENLADLVNVFDTPDNLNRYLDLDQSSGLSSPLTMPSSFDHYSSSLHSEPSSCNETQTSAYFHTACPTVDQYSGICFLTLFLTITH